MKSYKGWYRLVNPTKFVKPIDEHMKSYKDGLVNYKSKLELKSFRYCDYNKHIKSWSVEPFAIKYLSPQDGRIHRYYIDMFLEFKTGDKVLVEIKPKSQTVPPKKPKSDTEKSRIRYQQALMTYSINCAKWKAAREFASKNNMVFTFLTEEELG